MATSNKVFIPALWVPQKITASALSQSVALVGLTKSEDCVQVTNNTTETVHISFSVGAGAAAIATSVAIPSGAVIAFGVAPDVTHANAIGTGATGVIEFLVGKGS